MKRHLSLIIAILLALSLTACNVTSNTPDTPDDPSEIHKNENAPAVEVQGGNGAIYLSFSTLDEYEYSVFYKTLDDDDFAYVKVSNEFITVSESTIQCHISGISAGTYKVKIHARNVYALETFGITLTNIVVS
mgnify:CR=1 FL=1